MAYNRHVWIPDEIIMDYNLNNIEEGIVNEETRAIEAENSINSSISTENTRAMNAEKALSDKVDAENARATGAEQTLSDKIDSETARATSAEQTISDNLNQLQLDFNQEVLDRIDADENKIDVTQKGIPNGVAILDENGIVPSNELPSYVDDIIEVYGDVVVEDGQIISITLYVDSEHTGEIIIGEKGKIYLDIDDTKDSYHNQYRWSGTEFIIINKGGGTGGGHVIVDEDDTQMVQRSKLQFTGGVKVEDDEENDTTKIGLKVDWVFDTLTEAQAALEAGLLKEDDKVYIKEDDYIGKIDSELSLTSPNPVQNKTIARRISDLDYTEERDLTEWFADEIASYDSAWAWIQARLNANNLKGLHEGDFIPITVNSETYHMQIAGINTYLGGISGAVKTHIDWISKEVYSQTVQWNTTRNNNGNESVKSPFMASNLYSFLNNTLYPLLPAEVKAVIKPKQIYGPTRYSTASLLTDDNLWELLSFDKLWVPYEGEIFEHASWSTKYGTAAMVVYKLFANSLKARMKSTPSGELFIWWTASAPSDSVTSAVIVYAPGMSNYSYTSSAYRVPVCFRTMED